jgi:hypothetical protein
MELLSNIKYGRCFFYREQYCGRSMCCCECDEKCNKCCLHAKHNFIKTNCGNYYNEVDYNNLQLEKQIVIMLKLKEMSEVRKHREVYFHKKERTT